MRYGILRQERRLDLNIGAHPFPLRMRCVSRVVASLPTPQASAERRTLNLLELPEVTPHFIADSAGNVDLQSYDRHEIPLPSGTDTYKNPSKRTLIVMLIVSVCSDNKPLAGRQSDRQSTIFLGKRVDILREGIPGQYRSGYDEQQRPAWDEYVSKKTLQKPLVIGAIGLQYARGCQDDFGQYTQRLPGCSAEEVAPLGCGPIQIPMENKNSDPDEGGSCEWFHTS
jgi:hypothetical protein